MVPSATAPALATKPANPVTTNSSARAAQVPMPEAARTSAGETSAAKVALLSTKAVTAPDQTAVAPRLRDQETAERTDRASPTTDAPTGPPPTFEESPLERQARVALAPPEIEVTVVEDAPKPTPDAEGSTSEPIRVELSVPDTPVQDPPPTPSERAEASFAETRTLAAPREPASVDVSR